MTTQKKFYTRKKKVPDMLNDPPGRALLVFALPIIMGNLFQQFYNMVDGVVVSHFVGESALAAIGTTTALTNVFIAIAIGGSIGSSVVISQYFGSGKYGLMKKAITSTLINFSLISVLLGISGLFFCDRILIALHVPANVFADAKTYLFIYFWGLPFLFLYNTLSSIFNAFGDSRTPLKLLIFSSVFNAVLDLMLVAGFRTGVAGAAIATLLAQGISAVLSFYLLIKRIRDFPIDEAVSIYDLRLAFYLIRIAIPSIIQQSIVNIGSLLVQSVVNSFGSEMLAGYTAANRFESICIVPMIGVGNAVSTFTAQNIGANQMDRVKKGYRASYRLVICIAVFLCLVIKFFGRPLISVFLDADANAIAFNTGLDYLSFVGFFFVFIGLKASADGVLRGSGDTIVFACANLVNLTIRVWFAYTFSPALGIAAVWYAVPIGWFTNYLISFLWYLSGKWMEKIQVIEE